MNREDDFEQRLRSLKPIAPSDDEASVMYACGYAAGRNSVLNPSANGASWWKIAAAALVAGILSGWGGYGMAQRDAVEPQWATAPAEREQPPRIATEPPVDPPPQEAEHVMTAASDQRFEPVEPKRAVHWLPLTLDRLLNASASPVHSGDENSVVLTARSGSTDWKRWMEEQPFVDRRQQTESANDQEGERRGDVDHDALTPMQWRHGNIDWEQWIH